MNAVTSEDRVPAIGRFWLLWMTLPGREGEVNADPGSGLSDGGPGCPGLARRGRPPIASP